MTTPDKCPYCGAEKLEEGDIFYRYDERWYECSNAIVHETGRVKMSFECQRRQIERLTAALEEGRVLAELLSQIIDNDPGASPHRNPVYAPHAVTVTRLSASSPVADDVCRTATLEAVRGFENYAFAAL